MSKRPLHSLLTPEQLTAERERQRLSQRKARAKNPEKYRARDKARRTGNEEYKATKRAKYARDRVKILAKHRANYAANPEKIKEYNRKSYSANPEKHRAAKLKQAYGITLEQFRAMRASQGGACAICREPFSRTPHVDHCHASGEVRELLCHGCNHGLGQFKDDPERLEAAAEYIRKHRAPAITISSSAA